MKYLLFVLPILMIIASVAFCQEEDIIIFEYNFDDEAVGKPPSDPWKPTAAGEIEVVDFPDQVNKSVMIVDSSGGGGMQLLMDELIEDEIVSLEFRWLREEWGGTDGVEIFYIMNRNCPDDWSGVCLSTQGKSFQYNDSGAWIDVANIEDNAWHDVKLIMYLHENRFDFYWDDELIAGNAGFRKSDGLEGIDKFNVANVGNGGSTFIMYFDDIVLYKGTERNIAVESRKKLATVWGKVKIFAFEESYMEYPNGHKGTHFEKGLPSRSKFVR
jgi:hypothetical protein